MWLGLLSLVMPLKILQFLSQWEAKPKPIRPCKSDFFCTLGKSQVIARNSDCFIVRFAPVVTGRSNYFGIHFKTTHTGILKKHFPTEGLKKGPQTLLKRKAEDFWRSLIFAFKALFAAIWSVQAWRGMQCCTFKMTSSWARDSPLTLFVL